LIAERPHFHRWPDGNPANWAVAPEVLRFLGEQLSPGINTLETGAGQTTVVFCIAGTRHVAVTPDTQQAERIRAYLARAGVSCDLTFIHESSDVALPAGIGIPDRLDLVLIDGAHRFPFPMVDWHYSEKRVPVGGIVVIDDFRMPSVRILYDFLQGEDDWTLERAFQTTAFFRRLKKIDYTRDWADQKINKAHLERFLKKLDQDNAPFKHWLVRWLSRPR
jgi:Methyltransferase domain